jgi:hypothetical protein
VARLHKRELGGREVYEFVYVNEAQYIQGFQPFMAFPELEVAYHSDTLFPFFTNRVIPTTRRDYREYVKELGLSSKDASPETILARSGGQRATDHIELFAPPRMNLETGTHEMFFLLRGVRHLPPCTEERILALSSGERLLCMLDIQNPYNHRAITLRTADPGPHLLGYLPDYLVEDLAWLHAQNRVFEVVVDRVNPPPAPRRHRLLCCLKARWPEERLPFSDERFQPIVSDTPAAVGMA